MLGLWLLLLISYSQSVVDVNLQCSAQMIHSNRAIARLDAGMTSVSYMTLYVNLVLSSDLIMLISAGDLPNSDILISKIIGFFLHRVLWGFLLYLCCCWGFWLVLEGVSPLAVLCIYLY